MIEGDVMERPAKRIALAGGGFSVYDDGTGGVASHSPPSSSDICTFTPSSPASSSSSSSSCTPSSSSSSSSSSAVSCVSSVCGFDRLPEALSAQIFSHIGCAKAVASCRAVCKRWRELGVRPGALVFEGPVAGGLEGLVSQALNLTEGLETLEVFPSGKPIGQRREYYDSCRPYLFVPAIQSWVTRFSHSLRAVCLFDHSSSSEVLGRHICIDLIEVFSSCKLLTRLEVSKVQVPGERMSIEWRDMVTDKLYEKEKALYRRSGGCVLSSSSSSSSSSYSTSFGSFSNSWPSSSSFSSFPMLGDMPGVSGGGRSACPQQRGGGGGGRFSKPGFATRAGSGWGQHCVSSAAGGGGGGGGAAAAGVIEPAFPNLTRLKLTELLACSDEYLQCLLDECPALTSLDLHWGNPYEAEDETRHEGLVMNVVIDAPHLTDLRFAFAAYEEFHKCCLSLTTPKLRSLHVCADNEQALDVNLWQGSESLQSLDLSRHTVRLRFGLQPVHSSSSSSYNTHLSSSSSSGACSGAASANPSFRSPYVHLLYPLCSGLTEIKLRGWQWFVAKDLLFSNIRTLRHLHILAGANGPGDFFPEEVRAAEISLNELVERSERLRSLCIDLPGLRSVEEKMDEGTAVWGELGALCVQVEEANQRTSMDIDKVVKRCPRVKRVKVVTASDGGLSYMKRKYDLEDGTYKRFLSTEEEKEEEEEREGKRRRGSEPGGREGREVREQDWKKQQSKVQHMMMSQLSRHSRNAPVQVEII